jgi:uncharacterized membrane protein YbhN (UPF0104 family)
VYGALVALAGVGLLLAPALAGIPARLVEGCGRWVAAAVVLELLSALGFVILFKLVFATRLGWRRSVPAALRALGATTILPGGGLVGPTLGAWSASVERPSISELTRSTVSFAVLGNAPAALVLAGLGTLLWLGWLPGPREAALTLAPAMLAAGAIVATWLAGRPRRSASGPRRMIRPAKLLGVLGELGDAVREARETIVAGDWKLAGAVAYFGFDGAVLWAAFHAFAHAPSVSVIAMGYVVGSLAGAVPVPAGIGALDGGLIGALVLYGAPPAPAAAAVVLYRGITLLLPVVLGAAGCLDRKPRSRSVRVSARGRRATPAADPALARLARNELHDRDYPPPPPPPPPRVQANDGIRD